MFIIHNKMNSELMLTYDTPHICSMCIKTNQVGKQEVGMWQVQKRFPRYGAPIWSLWPNIRFLPSIVDEKNAMKNILGRTEGRTEVKQYTPPPVERGYKNKSNC